MKNENDEIVVNKKRNFIIWLSILILVFCTIFLVAFFIIDNKSGDDSLDKGEKITNVDSEDVDNETDDNSDDVDVESDLPEACLEYEHVTCTSISSDNELGKTYSGESFSKLDSLEKASSYSKTLAWQAAIGIGADNEYADMSKVAASDLYYLTILKLNAYSYYDGEYADYLCFEKSYLKSKVFELYDVNVDAGDDSWVGMKSNKYFCSGPGMGAGYSSLYLENEEYSVVDGIHIWKYYFGHTESDTLKYTMTTEFKVVDGLYKLKSLKVN